MLNEFFINQGIKESEIDEFIRTKFPVGDYSRTDIQRTPLGIKIVIWTNKPGRIIGKGGKNINDMTEAIKERFKLDNPQLDVKVIRRPNLDPRIVAKQIASALEKGYNYKKIGNLTMKRIMSSGAIGAQIVISGKLGGGKGVTGKFQEGYLKHCGEPSRTLVDYGFEEALTRPGKIGIKVKIMKQFQDITGQVRDTVEHKIDISSEEDAEKRERTEKKKEKHPKDAKKADGREAKAPGAGKSEPSKGPARGPAAPRKAPPMTEKKPEARPQEKPAEKPLQDRPLQDRPSKKPAEPPRDAGKK